MSVDSFSQNAKSLTRVSSLNSGNIYNYKLTKKVTRNGKNKNIAQQVREKLFRKKLLPKKTLAGKNLKENAINK